MTELQIVLVSMVLNRNGNKVSDRFNILSFYEHLVNTHAP